MSKQTDPKIAALENCERLKIQFDEAMERERERMRIRIEMQRRG